MTEEVDEFGFPIFEDSYKPKYKIGDSFNHIKFGECTVIDIKDEAYYVRTNEHGIKHLVAPLIDGVKYTPKKSYISIETPKKIVAGKYINQKGKLSKKEYFFYDYTENGLEIGDIGLPWNERVNSALPVQITRINISDEEAKEFGKLVYIKFVAKDEKEK